MSRHSLRFSPQKGVSLDWSPAGRGSWQVVFFGFSKYTPWWLTNMWVITPWGLATIGTFDLGRRGK